MNELGNSKGIVLVKTLVFLLVAAGLTAGNFFLESGFAGEVKKDNVSSGEVVIRVENEDSKMETRVVENGILYLLEHGHFWGNFSMVSARINLIAGKIVIIPNRSVFDLDFDGSRVKLAVYGGDVYVGFLSDSVEFGDAVDPYDGVFINRILVPRGTRVEIPSDKVNADIAPLLYSKLSKEFKLSSIPDSDGGLQWVKSNMEQDLKFLESARQAYVADVIHEGVSVDDSLFSDAVFWAEENLTFVPAKKNSVVFEHLFEYLNAAIFHLVKGDSAASDLYFAKFETYYDSLPLKISGSADYYRVFDEYLSDLALFNPNDALYDLWEALIKRKFATGQGAYDVVNEYWLDVYEGMEISDEAAAVALGKYYEYFDKTLGGVENEKFYKMYLTYQNQLLDNLFLRNSLFYEDAYFEMKNVFEQNLLVLYSEGQLKAELRQLFVSNKIDLMKRLRKFFFDGRLDVKETGKIFDRLIDEVDELMPQENSGVAVVKLFQSQLDDIIDFWGYLENAEYHTNAYGFTHRERYEFYLKERDIVSSVDDLLASVLGEDVEKKTVDDAVKEVGVVLRANADISDLVLGSIDDPDQRYVGVNAIIGGYPFEATYDRYQDSLKDVYVYGDLVSAGAVKLGNLLTLLQSEFADLAEDLQLEEEDEEITEDTIAQRVARKNIVNVLSEYGFVADIDEVSVIDLLNVSYRIEGIQLEGYDNVKLTFDLVMSGEELVTNLFLEVKGEPRVFDGKYSIQELVDMVVAESTFVEKPVEELEENSVENSEKVER